MTINARTRQGCRYLFGPRGRGPLEVVIDGVIAPDVWYVDMRRRVARQYVRDDQGLFFVRDREIVWREIRAKEIRLIAQGK